MPTEGIEFRKLSPQPTLVAHAKAPVHLLGPTVGELFGKVFAYASRKGAAPAGKPFARFLSFGDLVELEAGTAVKKPMPGKGEVVAGTLPGGETCVAWHLGPYDRAVDTYNAMRKFMVDHGKTPGPSMWEVYFSDPKSEPDSSKWRTEVFWPVA